MGRQLLSDEMLPLVAEGFRALAEPARLTLLRTLRRREHTVSELVLHTGMGQANVSKHLQVLHTLGFVTRRKHGLFVYYGISDRQVIRLCELMCARVQVRGPELTAGERIPAAP